MGKWFLFVLPLSATGILIDRATPFVHEASFTILASVSNRPDTPCFRVAPAAINLKAVAGLQRRYFGTDPRSWASTDVSLRPRVYRNFSYRSI